MILTESQLASQIREANIINDSTHKTRMFSHDSNATIFLSHKHDDLVNLKRVICILENLSSNVYLDWLDSSMPKITSGETAVKIKQRIAKQDKFILVASDAAIESKWCNWELGYGDAQKYEKGKIALFPIRQTVGKWKGNEYMSIYPTIQYYDDRYKYKGITKGFYYRYKKNDKIYLKPLIDWLNS